MRLSLHLLIKLLGARIGLVRGVSRVPLSSQVWVYAHARLDWRQVIRRLRVVLVVRRSVQQVDVHERLAALVLHLLRVYAILTNTLHLLHCRSDCAGWRGHSFG